MIRIFNYASCVTMDVLVEAIAILIVTCYQQIKFSDT